MGKRIEIVERRVGDLRLDFGNPRKIQRQKREELEESLDRYGDFGTILINESNQVIGGNQRVTIFQKKDPDMVVTCKMLIGYTLKEQKYINIKANSHAGEWDLAELGEWTSDLVGAFNLDFESKPPKEVEDRPIKEMELIHYEKYNFVLICCRNELDYNDLLRKLDLEGKKIRMAKSRKIAARAVWYEDIASQISFKEEQ